jgi:WD40 repeat protein
LAFGPGGALYAVSQPPETGAGTVVTRWDVATGRRVGRWPGPDPGRYGTETAVSPDGGTLAVGTHRGVVRLYDTRAGDEVVRPPALAAEVIGLSFDAAGAEVRAVGADGSAATYDAATGATRARRGSPVPLPAPGAALPVVASPDGRWVMTYALNPDGPFPPWGADLRDATTGARKYGFGVEGRVTRLAPISGGTLLAGLVEVPGGLDARVWDTATGKAMPWFGLLINRDRGRYTVSPDGSTFLVMDEGEAIGYDPATGRRRFSWKPADHDVLGVPPTPADQPWGKVRAVAVSPDGKTAAVAVGGDVFADAANRTDVIVLVEAQTGRVIRRVRNPETPTTWLVFSPDGRWVAGPRCVWEVSTLREVRRFPAKPELSAAAFSPDGKRVATGHVNGTAVVWPVVAD